MTTETDSNRGRFFVTFLLPWLLGGGMFLLYLLTLNPSASTNGIYRITELGGWPSPHRFFNPVTFLATYPLHWLPAASVGMGLNIFTAVCAALTLALLARSVVLLPHDRTYDQRQREQSEFSCLTISTAWLPPLFAVLICGLQMTFWENATNSAGSTIELTAFSTDAAGQVFDLLLFAYAIRCLLEFRVSFKESWIACGAFVYGLGIADNWLMLGLFPGFLAALIWIRGLGFFNLRSLGILTLAGLAGLAFIFFFPICSVSDHSLGIGFWDTLRYILKGDKSFITGLPRELWLPLSLTSLIPILVIGIRWASYFGDTSQVGIFVATFIFHVFHAVFFLACIWVAFDPPLSPRRRAFGLAMLPLYYLGALSVGYFAGYFLLIFGTRPPKERRRPHPFIQSMNFAVVAVVWILAATVPAFQAWKNLSQLRATQTADAAFARLTSLSVESLPAKSAVVLSDDRLRLLLLQYNLQRSGRAADYVCFDTGLLSIDPEYVLKTEKKYPSFSFPSDLPRTNTIFPALLMFHVFDTLAQKHPIYYLHPSFGIYFEHYYMEPHGLVYQLKAYDPNTWKKPPLTTGQIDENQKIWKDIVANELPIVTNLIGLARRPITSPFLAHIMDSGHLTIESNMDVLNLASHYARSLDYWGVELEKASLLPEAAKCFEEALQFNPNNLAARVNVRFNHVLQTGKTIAVSTPAAVRDEFDKFRTWDDLLRTDGPFDDPGFCYALGENFAGGENYREGSALPAGRANFLQAIQQFERVHTLAPDFLGATLWLSKLYLHVGMNSDLVSLTGQMLQSSPDNPIALFCQAIAFMQLKSYDKAIPPLNHLLTLQTNNYAALMERAISYLQLSNYPAAKMDYEALNRVDFTNSMIPTYRIDYGLQEIAYHDKDTNAVIKYIELYLSNYYKLFPTNYTPPDNDEIKAVKQRLKESKNGAP